MEAKDVNGKSFFFAVAGVLVMAGGAGWAGEANATPAPDSLESGFVQPPDSARPWVYWFWLNGNITREGITADLEAMQRVGIGGVLIMEVDQGAPVGPVDFMSDQWRQMFSHVISEAQRLGIEVNMNDAASWQGSGGPWIKPEQSMQKVVWSETKVKGGERADIYLAQPETVAGYYEDVAVLAFPTPGDYRIPNIEYKALFKTRPIKQESIGEVPPEMIIPRDKVVDLSGQMGAMGRLKWDPPKGDWTVVRFGHTSRGNQNSPSPVTGMGLECDKLSKEGIEANFEGMIAKLVADAGPAVGKTFVATHVDSWENGSQNWTARMREEFKSRRGYDPVPFLPVMTGRVVGSLEISERFLWDLRQTATELINDYYAGRLRELAHEHGLRLTMEAYFSPNDELPYSGRADEHMAEFWVSGDALETCREMASAAHVWGPTTIVGAEAFTAGDAERWRDFPGSIKALGDTAFCSGINRFVFHRYAMQPWVTPERRPGMTMGPWGIHYERTETWWDMTPAWHLYLARCQQMLRQGRYVADVCYLQPEANPQRYNKHSIKGYGYDNICAEAVFKRMGDSLSIPGAADYRVLVLPDVPTMTPELLGRIKQLVEKGATVVGPRPLRAPGLSAYPQCDADVQRLADELWADCDGKAVREHALGAGLVLCGVPVEHVLQDMGVKPDFETNERLNWIHRSTGDADIYFVANPGDRGVGTVCTFRVSGKAPELWWPDTGAMEKTALWQADDGRTRVYVSLPAGGSVFVVFRNAGGNEQPVLAVSRDGQPFITVARQPREYKVASATYGVPGDPAKSRDVAADLQRLLDSGTRAVNVGDLAKSGETRRLSVEYTVGGVQYNVSGQDNDTVYFTDEPIESIDKAVWGPPGDVANSRDMTGEVRRIVGTGARQFEVLPLAKPGDPTSAPRNLTVEYTAGGQHLTATARELEIVAICPPGDNETSEKLVYDAAGRPVLETRTKGKYQVQLAGGGTREAVVDQLPEPLEVSGPWDVSFPPNSGAPERVKLDKLASLSTNADPGVAHFSGVATWNATFNVPAGSTAEGRRFYLDLGRVEVMAQVSVNGKDLGVLWKAPYTVDVTGEIKPGDNAIVVQVANRWINRMIGDAQLADDSNRKPEGNLAEWPQWLLEGKPSPAGKYTFSTWNLWKKDDPLPDSGLIGPVKISAAQRQAL